MRLSMFLTMSLAWTTYSFGAAAQSEVELGVAREMYNHGFSAFERGDYAVCVGDMAASFRAVPRPMALFYLAKCEELTGKIASAEAHFSQFLTKVRELSLGKQTENQDKIEHAERARKRMAPNIPTLTLVLPAWAPKNVEVARDGKVVPLAAIGVAIPLDPGEHLVTTQVPGGLFEAHRFTVQRKEAKAIKLRIDMPSRLDPAKPSPSLSRDDVLRSLRTPAYVSLGVGGAALLTWAIAGVIMIHEESTVETYCAQNKCPLPENSPDLNTLRQSAERGTVAANIASVGLGLGLTGGVLGTAMFIGSSQRFRQSLAKSAVRVDVGRDGMVFGMRGTF